MIRTMRHTLTAMLIAAVAFAGVTATVRAEDASRSGSTINQQSQSAQDRMDSATDRAAERAGQTTDRAIDRTQSQFGQYSQQPQSMGGQQQAYQMQPTLPQGVTQKDMEAKGEVRDSFAGLTKAALKPDGYNNLIDHFAKTDRDRLKGAGDQPSPELNAAIDQFHQAWKSKYNEDFSLSKDRAFGDQFLSVIAGTIDHPEQVQYWPVNPLGAKPSPQTSQPSMNKGTDVAIAALTAGQKACHVSLVKEGTDWKIDIPDSVTADQIKSGLARHLSEATAMQSQWPSDRNEAERVIVSHILRAVYNVSKQDEMGAENGQMGRGQMGTQPGQDRTQPGPLSTQPGSPDLK